jgi:hypothetical protein
MILAKDQSNQEVTRTRQTKFENIVKFSCQYYAWEKQNTSLVTFFILARYIPIQNVPIEYKNEAEDLFDGALLDFDPETLKIKRKRLSKSFFHNLILIKHFAAFYHYSSFSLEKQCFRKTKSLKKLSVFLENSNNTPISISLFKYIKLFTKIKLLQVRIEGPNYHEADLMKILTLRSRSLNTLTLNHDIFYEDQIPYFYSLNPSPRSFKQNLGYLTLEFTPSLQFCEKLTNIIKWQNIIYQSDGDIELLKKMLQACSKSREFKIRINTDLVCWRDFFKAILDVTQNSSESYFCSYRGKKLSTERILEVQAGSKEKDIQNGLIQEDLIWAFLLENGDIKGLINSFFLSNLTEILQICNKDVLFLCPEDPMRYIPVENLEYLHLKEENFFGEEENCLNFLQGVCIILELTPKLKRLELFITDFRFLDFLKPSFSKMALDFLCLRIEEEQKNEKYEALQQHEDIKEESEQNEKDDDDDYDYEDIDEDKEDEDESDEEIEEGSGQIFSFEIIKPKINDWANFFSQVKKIKTVELDFFGQKKIIEY